MKTVKLPMTYPIKPIKGVEVIEINIIIPQLNRKCIGRVHRQMPPVTDVLSN